ncbi:DegV family protein [Adlercreutzia sp. R25]|uniref:DegV family protein n=1 Tax=Adlercreutzia shanghongiae TaxID=3111773 RepID=A0ABU6J1B0_9ACTN|nr:MULTISPECIES: DegV family protein [unclassified Adlercreutzia]MEC4273364.1 DegV family protein [Adlercreutzia sp. R25]MEC4295597.1 DegV family protein [Adlercreutzia sp. R22]
MVKIVTDSVASIPAEVVRERDIEVVSLFVNREGREYREADMDVEAFYEDIADMIDNPPTSSQPSQHALEALFERAAEAKDEVLGVFMSSKMSGTFEGAVRSARVCKERFEEFRCTLIDSTSNCGDEMFAVLDAADARDAGSGLEACAQAAVGAVASSRFIFAPESLAFLKAGGRIGGASALLGGLLQISPVLTVADWETATLAKVRTWKKTLARMVDTFKEDVEACGLKRVVVHYIGSAAPAVAWAREAIEPVVGHAVDVLPVSPVIGVHVGPAVGLAYECERPVPGKFTQPTSELVFSL